MAAALGPIHRPLLLALSLCTACAPSLDVGSKELGTESSGGDDGSTTGSGDGGGDEGGGSGGDDGGDDGTSGPVDADGDGYTADEDCDDTDPGTHPDAEEIHDGQDNDCDEWVDEVEVCDDGVGALQDAIDDAPDGATILLCPGEWTENVLLDRRELTIAGEQGAELTILNGGGTGRALTLSRSTAVLKGLTLTNGTDPLGGVAVCSDGEATFTDVIIQGGTADDGGGLAVVGCRFTLERTTVQGNQATRYGGGLFTSGASGDIIDSTIDGNVALEGGGAFTYDGAVNYLRSTISANEATSLDEAAWGPGAGGGGLWSSGGAVRDSFIIGNVSAYQAGGAYFYRGSHEFTGNVVDGNYCGEDGGGIYFNVSSAVIEDNLFQNNEAADDAGGLRLYFGSSHIENNEFYDNVANDDGGGAKFSHSEHEFIGNYMEGNRTGDAGGGLELDNDSSYVADSVFINNSAHRGAGLHNWRTERSFTIESSEFYGNEATDCGGGLQFDNSPHLVTVHNLWLEGNSANDGAGLCVDRIYRDPEDVGGQENFFQDTILSLQNLTFTGNTAGDDGGAIYVRAGIVDIVNNVMDDNSGVGVAAIAVKGSPVTLTNTIVSNNSGGAALYTEDTEDGPGTLTVTYSAFHDNSSVASGLDDPRGTDGNIDSDPDFDTAAGDYSLQSGSPCIDAGDPALTDPDGSRSDIGVHGGPGAP